MSWVDGKPWSPETKRQVKKHIRIMEPTATLIERGDPRFDEIEAQCTKPKDIKVRHGMNQSFIAAPIDKKCKLRNSEKDTI